MRYKTFLLISMVAVSSLLPAVQAQSKKPNANGYANRNHAPTTTRPTFRANSHLVVVRTTVMDPWNHFVMGLGQEQFRMYEDKVEQTIVHFVQEDTPISVGIIFDISGSMKDHFPAAKKSIVRFLENGDSKDEFFLITFNHKVTLETDLTNQASNIQNVVSFRSPSGRTALYDAVYLGLQKLRDAHQDKKALILITDGEDNSSRYSFSEVKEFAKETDAQIYVLGAEGRLHFGQSIIKNLVNLTGGRAFFPHNFNDLEYYVGLIHSELRNQYILGYFPSNKAHDGKWRKVKVKIDPIEGLAKLIVRAREGYYGPKD